MGQYSIGADNSAPNVYALNCVRLGEVLVLQPKFDVRALLELVSRHRLSHMQRCR